MCQRIWVDSSPVHDAGRAVQEGAIMFSSIGHRVETPGMNAEPRNNDGDSTYTEDHAQTNIHLASNSDNLCDAPIVDDMDHSQICEAMADIYWRTQLNGVEPTSFPDLTGKPSSARGRSSGLQVAEYALSRHLSGQNSNAIYLAACAKVIALYVGEHELCLNYLLRTAEATQTTGDSTVLPLRVTVEPSSQNHDIFSQIEHKLGQARTVGGPSAAVLHEVSPSSEFVWSNILVVIDDFLHLNATGVTGDNGKYDIIFEVVGHGEVASRPPVIKLHFRSSLVLPCDTQHVLAAFEEATHSVSSHPSSRFLSWTQNSALQMSRSNSKYELAGYCDNQTVHTAFEQHARQQPDGIALDFLEEDGTRTSWSFATLNHFANRIANALVRDYGVCIEDSVPICLPKCPAFYACVLGVLKTGANFTPFYGSPRERQRYMYEELGSKVLLHQDEQDMSWCSGATKMSVTALIQQGSASTVTQNSRPLSPVQSSYLCYQMYTSGSTGRPKAVSLEHRNAVQTACAARGLVPWKVDSRILQQAGVTFDMCYFETFFAWTVGICLCSAPDSTIYNKLTDVINEMNISLLGLTPSVALTLDPEQVPNVKWMYCIGEPLPQSLVNSWEGRLVNSYGPTEAAQMVTLFPVNRDIKSTVIGKPFKNTSFTILQENTTEVVPILGVGELCIGGHQVARGYYKNSKKTEQAFIMLDGQRLYRTGDLTRMLSDGNFEYIGRIDDQVKVRGQRVELGEIDSAVQESHEAIKGTCTQILKVNDQSKSQLVTFIVLGLTANDSKQSEIRQIVERHLSDVLPTYMIPRMFLFVEKIPLTLSGKADKRTMTQTLRGSDQVKAAAPSSTHDASQGVLRLLQQIYSSFCGVQASQIDPDMSIYQLGIDSISAIQIAHTLTSKGFRVQASDIMNYSTITKLSAVIGGSRSSNVLNSDSENPAFDYAAFDREHRSEVIQSCDTSGTKIAYIRPASPLQSSMIAQSLNSTGGLYFNHLSYRCPGYVDVQQFRDAWEALVSKHEMLRSGFVHLNNSAHPVAMVTFYARSCELPIHILKAEVDDLGHRRERFIQNATQHIHIPPWQVLLSQKRDKFYLSIHHALYDAQVLDILIRDLALAYDGQRLPESPAFEPHLTSRLLRSSVQQESDTNFWKQWGAKAIPSKFPLLHPVLEDPRGIQVATAPSPLSLAALEKGCKTAGISMQAAAQAAWGHLLGALTGESLITFGTVLSGRSVEDSTEVVFPMITTVPTTINNQMTPLDVVHELMGFNANVQNHQFISLKEIQKVMGFAGESLFDTIFTFQKRSHVHVTGKTSFNLLGNDLEIEYPVSVELETTETGQLEFSVYYRSNVMRREQADLLVDQFHFLLRRIIFQKDSTSAITTATADQHLFSITPAVYEYLPSQCSLLHHCVEMTARDNPNKVALEFVTRLDLDQSETLTWTFRNLDEEGNRIAHLLRERGVRQGSLVAICFEKAPEAAFAMLGISKAGCGFLALDPGAPTERKKFIVQDSQASILLSKAPHAEYLSTSLPVDVVNIGTEDMTRYSTKQPRLDRPVDAQETAYCLYTSGTTGTPKGCLVTHENVIQVFMCFDKLYEHSNESRWLQFASYHFDVSVMEHFWSWFVGMTVVTASRDLILQDISSAISALKISHIDLTPSLARLLDPRDVPSLARGVFVTGGEMLRRDIIEAWGDSGAIHNAYGPTEATIGVTMYRKVPKNGRPSNIGWPFAVVGIFITHPSNPEVPVLRGGIGELIIIGKLVAKGYLRREQLTKERFIEIDGHRCYRTGDLVRILSDGSIEFLGRADDQVKLRGQRLEIGEINSVIKQRSKEVDDVCTLVLKHPKQQKEQLVSFVSVQGSPQGSHKLSLSDATVAQRLVPNLRTACLEKLPGYMIPTHILLVNRMPLSANNKVESKQLKALYDVADTSLLQSLACEDVQQATNESHQEGLRSIMKILSSVLGAEPDGISHSTNFFELGLDSISVISLSKALRAGGYKQASPSLIMKHATISTLSAAMSELSPHETHCSMQLAKEKISDCQNQSSAYAKSLLSVCDNDIELIMPCTHLQAGIVARSLDSNQKLYFTAFSFNLNRTVDVQKLRQAYQTVCDHVQILRTKFVQTEEGFIQVVLRKLTVPWFERETTVEQEINDKLEDAHRVWRSKNEQNILQPFEVILSRTPQNTVLTLHIFHGLYDGNSLPLLIKAVACEYNGTVVADYGPSFSDCLPYGPLREMEGAKDFWLAQLSGSDGTSKSSLKPQVLAGAEQSTCAMHRVGPIDELERCRRNLNVTHQAILQACWTVLLQDFMSSPLVIGLIVSGRSIDFDGADSVIGPLFNTIPFFLQLSRHDTWKDIIMRCHEFNRDALSYQHTPLRDIQKWARKGRVDSSLFESLFVFRKDTADETDASELWTPREEKFELDYPLAFEVQQTTDGGFNLTLACQASICDELTSNSLLQRFARTLEQMVQGLDTSMSEIFTDESALLADQFHARPDDSTSRENSIPKLNNDDRFSEILSQTARDVQEIIATVAGVELDQVCPHTSIFEVGLDSIDAVKLSSRFKQATGAHLPVSRIMRLLTLQRIVAAIEESEQLVGQQDGEDNLEVSSKAIEVFLRSTNIDLANAEKALPCTPLQESLVADMLNSDFQRYLNFDVLELHDETDLFALKTAWIKIVEACPILRTRFTEIDDPSIECTVAQIVGPASAVQVDEIEVQVEDGFTKIFSDIRSDVMRTFAMRPASRLTFVSDLKNNKRYLILTLPHAMYDGWSLGLVHDLVKKTYRGSQVEIPSYEPALLNILRCVGQESSDFWRQYLDGVQSTLFSSQETSHQAIRRKQVASQISSGKVLLFCKENKVTVAALCQTVWSIVLAHSTQQLDVSFGQILSGRTDEATDDVVFPTMNTVISRSVLTGTRKEMVHCIQDALSATLEHQHFPLRKALALASNKRTRDLFNTLFIFQKVPNASHDGMQPYESVESESNVEYPLCVEAEMTDTGITWRTAYQSSLVCDSDVDGIHENLNNVLKAVLDHPSNAVVEHLEDRLRLCDLPPISVPTQIVDNRDSLPEDTDASIEKQWSPTDQAIREVIASVAKLDSSEIAKKSSLLGLGLDSISIIKVSSLLRKQGLKISVNEILSANSIDSIAKLVAMDGSGADVPPNLKEPAATHQSPEDNGKILRHYLDKIDVSTLLAANSFERDAIEQVLPATAGQMLLLSRWQNEGIYYSSLDFSIIGCEDTLKLESVWSALVQRSPMLRTVFVATGQRETPVLQVTLRTIRPQFKELNANIDLKDEIHQSLNFDSATVRAPCALFVQRIANGNFNLALKISHALYDGFSLKMLIAEFQQLINEIPFAAAAVPYKFADYIADGGHPYCRRQFWTEYMSDLQFQSFAQKKPSADLASIKQLHVVETNVLDRFSLLRGFGRKHHVSIQSLLLASYSTVHARTLRQQSSGQDDVSDVVVGVFLANRNIEGSDELAAPTLSFTPIRVKQPLSRSLADVARGIQSDMREISENGRSQIGLWELQDWIGGHIKVDVWVNLLRQWLPNEPDKGSGNESIQIVTGEKSEDLERLYDVQRHDDDVVNGLLLKNNAVRAAYDYPMIDLEVTVKDDNLDIGIQAPTTLLDFDDARRMIREVSAQLDELVGEEMSDFKYGL